MEVQDNTASITLEELNKHNSKTDCWIAVHSKVWDITDFVSEHPGGPAGKSLFPISNQSAEISKCC